MTAPDVVVVGLGAVGSATAYQLAKRGASVLGVDRFSPPHAYGSSHGETRITRQAIGEGAAYVPLVLRANEIWAELEASRDVTLRRVTGGLVLGRPGSASALHGRRDFLGSTITTARAFGIEHEVLSTEQLRSRFPQFHGVRDEIGYYEPGAGLLHPERCVETQLLMAREHGATLRFGETVRRWTDDGRGVELTTGGGRVVAGAAVLAAGPWMSALAGPPLARCLTVYRQVMYWFDVASAYEAYAPGTFPVFIWDLEDEQMYGLPAVAGPDGGVKVAVEDLEHGTDPDEPAPAIDAARTEHMYTRSVRPRLRGVGARCVRAVPCLYTCTPDFGFLVDRHPASQRVMVVSACSGHGFKHSAAIGEAVAEQVLGGRSSLDLSAFALERMGQGATGGP